MADTRYLDWPFLEDRHRQLARELDAWAAQNIPHGHGPDVDAECRELVRRLGQGGWLHHAVAGGPGTGAAIDTRAICLIRETLARHSGLADFAFAMQGLGSGAISLHGTPAQTERYLARVARGEAIAAFALSEPEAGSDVAAMQCSARVEGDHAVLDGEKTWISNGGIADFYVVFCRTNEAPGARGISAFIVDAGTPGFEIAERIHVIAPHPLARLRFTNCRIPLSQRIGAAGEGFKIAMRTLDVFRTSVAAAALGFARRALDEALRRATTRRMFNQALADFQLTQAKLAGMATTIDSSALLVYRAAWQRDQGRNVTREAAMAKLTATEGAQQVIDAAVQIFGGLGVVSGQVVESLYREIRALRIYEGASEVQQLIIARELLKDPQETSP
ncbi:acyl-CoA dehydrogenase family protein [Ramlibacter tataouinensis]|uniref:Butyryl-CoA dehydrogenase (Short-chain-acyl-CoA dehydrogenase)-like protein n=1 Tax=Ramlibacter tataouinensis (strain ATCC BAA-407 / DSM 14655 / LMG 21543 / TTB310) TaxID=365046 RepID=F5XWF2_RAMTT|nr:acyl-CoA dehydrogenase family protein [Ramlibacter tataouinensis]AEG92906.1 Butyryl-CoA dehydrogenase (Short-chain-acyl-CoA dehydrogenase)-like protein [Ramlibacter tataouinensis TTB310]